MKNTCHSCVPAQTSLPTFLTVHWIVESSPEKFRLGATTEVTGILSRSGAVEPGA